jgi:hypothetical protein
VDQREKDINSSSRQRDCYVRTMTVRVQLKKNPGHKPQGAWRRDELIGGKRQSQSNSESDSELVGSRGSESTISS